MKLFGWFRRAPRHDPQQRAVAEQRMQRVMQGFQTELESIEVPAESAPPGQMPEILSRPPTDYEGGSSDYPWAKQSAQEPPSERGRRY